MGSLLSTKDIDATVDAVMLQLEHPLLEKSLTAPRNWLFRQSELCWRFKRLDMSLWIVHVYFVHASLACRSLWHVVHTWWKLSPFTFLVLLVILNWKKEKRNEYEVKRKKRVKHSWFCILTCRCWLVVSFLSVTVRFGGFPFLHISVGDAFVVIFGVNQQQAPNKSALKMKTTAMKWILNQNFIKMCNYSRLNLVRQKKKPFPFAEIAGLFSESEIEHFLCLMCF